MELARALMFAARRGAGAGSFAPSAPVSRVEQAVALVRALRLDAQAKALANSNVTWEGQVLTDNADIPGNLRGYVQLALDRGLMESFPAEVREIGPGQFQALPGPRFEPNRVVKRAELLNPASRLIELMFGE